MAEGSWDTSLNMMDIPYYPELTILSFRSTCTAVRSGNVTWSRETGKVQALTRNAYGRDLYLKQVIQCVLTFFTLQYMAQSTNFPGHEGVRAPTLSDNILVYMTWCDHQGVSISLTKPDGGRRYGLDRCRSQMPCPLSYQMLSPRGQGWVADCRVAKIWTSLSPRANPPHMRVIPWTFEYLRIYFQEWAYMEPQRQAETGPASKRRVLDTLRSMSTAETKPREVRIVQLQPTIDWSLVWGNLHNVIFYD
jgi:hypothetical protein